jgi:putative ABC transport system substrate-binding protein
MLEVTRISLPRDAKMDWLQAQVDKHEHEIVIAVGNQSYKLCDGLNTASTVIAGGISGQPNGIPTLSLTADPNTAIAHLKRIAPEIRDIRIVYSEPMNGWWYEQAARVASSHGLQIYGYPANDLKQGVELYEQMIDEAVPTHSAIWIPLRSIVPSKTILPYLLGKAWEKKLSVVSNNPSHTKMGGLMALYPEHESMGVQLAEFALAHYKREAGIERITGTKRLRLAVNLRTGAHMGLRFSTEERETFDKIFPEGR